MDKETLANLLRRKVARHGAKVALTSHRGQAGIDRAETYTYRDIDEASGRLAAGFLALGVAPGDRVAILCDPRPRWGVVFFAAVRAGAVVVPLDTRLTPDALRATLAGARPAILVVSAEYEATAAGLAADHRSMRILSIEPDSQESALPSIDTLAEPGDTACVARGDDDPAVLTYTSGTMGESKGVVTTYGNLLFQIRAFRRVVHNDMHSTSVSILPLSHLFELTAGFLGVLYGGGRICYCASLLPDDIAAAMREQRVTCMTTVPLFLKLLGDGIRREIDRLPRIHRIVAASLLAVAPALPLSVRRRLFRRIHRRFGGQLEYFVCGGAPLDDATLAFFNAIGIPVYQGYGLAEASPVIATNAGGANRDGSVGRPLPGIEVRIAADREILTRGPHVMQGYFGDAGLTRSVIDADGWLHTGDLGYLDADGYLYVTGRQKNAIVLGSGKKVQPEELEDLLFEHPDIEEGCVVGVVSRSGLSRGSEEVCAVAVASPEAVSRCAGRPGELDRLIRTIIEQRARRVAPCKRPSRIVLRSEPLPRTSTRKIRRPDVGAWLNREVAAP